MANRKNVIANRYEVLSHIGQGGMADVFLALDTIISRQVAVKILRADMNTDAVSILRFEREAQAAAALSHPNIVDIYDVGEYKGHHYIVMEYVTGKTLKQVIRSRGPLLNEEAVDIMKQLCSAIAEAHSRGIIHRDIKPQNIIVKSDGSIKILDFGIATALGAMQLTQTNNVMGSVHYLAPELAKGEPASVQSDIYALGICLYEMLSADVPFKADQAIQVALKQMREQMPSVRAINDMVPQSIENIITRATAKNPSQRYTSADEMLKDISTCLLPERVNEKKLYVRPPEAKKPVQQTKTSGNKSQIEQPTIEEPVIKAKPKKMAFTTKLLLLIVSLLVVAGVISGLIVSGVISIGNKMIPVPNLEGKTIAEARAILEEDKLILDENVSYTLTSGTEKGQIISVSPEIGTTIEQGQKVTITVSSGIGVKVPDFRGKNINDVIDQLSKYKLLKVNTSEEESDKPGGEILRQEQLVAGSLFDENMAAQITLVFSAYPVVTIPKNIIGKPVNDAVKQLEELGVVVRTSNRDTTQMTQEELDAIKDKIGTVIDCDPAAGTSYIQKEDNYITLFFY